MGARLNLKEICRAELEGVLGVEMESCDPLVSGLTSEI